MLSWDGARYRAALSSQIYHERKCLGSNFGETDTTGSGENFDAIFAISEWIRRFKTYRARIHDMSRPAGPVLDHDDWGKSTRACK
jgi:hypothetical protein